MAIHATGYASGIASSNPDELAFATDRLRAEHEELREKLRILETSAKEVILSDDLEKGMQLVRELRGRAHRFVEVLERHSDWEERELFPFLLTYYDRHRGPSILPSFWVLEKDHKLGLSFIESFQEAASKITTHVSRKQLAEITAHLVQACLILNDHLTMEEQLVFPITEQVMTDLESFFC
ncbi:hemerythrin domain-containing protein [Paenibacillus aceris]|uniref:Hemerythrin-like domain-containing protein n=1 Tax=Paenibacillus aceris TaxID=869555 RepID=A0ABS4HW28_9BACL|nr:hemerythrin domain-containing protein [Paenibacillus aceris]MBP1962154.1 hemerythrin-like domain-containing protein [Paenibacillus aceris]NHW33998.1 hemerythrin domain-containing protein [Paenibacillus aceris]